MLLFDAIGNLLRRPLVLQPVLDIPNNLRALHLPRDLARSPSLIRQRLSMGRIILAIGAVPPNFGQYRRMVPPKFPSNLRRIFALRQPNRYDFLAPQC